jgi:hypothetical protein
MPTSRPRDWPYLTDVSTAAVAYIEAEEELWTRVAEARAHGLTWEDIGRALGTSKQAAHERFTKPPRGRLV